MRAHIRWHQAHGPATIPNGIALCALHHELFDAGTFTLSSERPRTSVLTYSRPRRATVPVQRVADDGPAADGSPRPIVVVAPFLTGEGLDDALGRYDRMPVHLPSDRDLWPSPVYLKWHARHVFKSPEGADGALRVPLILPGDRSRADADVLGPWS